jgi:hypothetical protein
VLPPEAEAFLTAVSNALKHTPTPEPSEVAEATVLVPRRLLSGLLDETDYEESNALHAEANRLLGREVAETTAGEREVAVIDAIEETFLAHLPSKALSYCAQEDIDAGLDAMRERFGLGGGR